MRLRDGVPHLFENEEAVFDFESDVAPFVFKPILLIEVVEVHDEQAAASFLCLLWQDDDVLEEDVSGHEHHGQDDGLRNVAFVEISLELRLALGGQPLLEVEALGNALQHVDHRPIFRNVAHEVEAEAALVHGLHEVGVEVPKYGVGGHLDVGLLVKNVDLGDRSLGRKHVVLSRNSVVEHPTRCQSGVHLPLHHQLSLVNGH